MKSVLVYLDSDRCRSDVSRGAPYHADGVAGVPRIASQIEPQEKKIVSEEGGVLETFGVAGRSH
jgi:hypothetical protein